MFDLLLAVYLCSVYGSCSPVVSLKGHRAADGLDHLPPGEFPQSLLEPGDQLPVPQQALHLALRYSNRGASHVFTLCNQSTLRYGFKTSRVCDV